MSIRLDHTIVHARDASANGMNTMTRGSWRTTSAAAASRANAETTNNHV